MKMFSEWSDLVATLNDIERRIEIIQIHQDLDEQNNPTIPRDRPNRHYYKSSDQGINASGINSNIQVFSINMDSRHMSILFRVGSITLPNKLLEKAM